MSETTTTPNYGLIKPNVNADSDLWGDHWNQNADTLDSKIKSIENKAGVVTWNTRSGAVSLTQLDVTTVLPPSAATPVMDGTASAGTNMTWSKSDHVHPTDTTRYAASNPAGYVTAGGAATAAPVQSVATRTGAVVLTHTDITDWTPTLAPYAPLASPALTGSPTAPTVSPTTDSSTKLATTAFVQSALGAVPGGAIVSATPPTANPGALWFDSTGGQTYCRYDDGNTVQWVPVSNITGLANAAQLSDVAPAYNNVGRNLIHNSMFNIAQRGAGPFTVLGNWGLDRWQLLGTDAISVIQSQLNDAGRAAVGDEAAYNCIVNTFTGTAGAAAYSATRQSIENVRRLAGKSVIVSFWAWSGAGTPKLGVSLEQGFGSGGSPSAGVTGIGSTSVTLSTTQVRYTATITVPSAAGKTLGTNNNDATYLWFWFSSGATNNAAAGNIGVQSGTIALWGIQCEVAAPGQTQPTPLEKPDPELQLRQCQRFYETNQPFMLIGYGGAASILFGQWFSFLVPKRSAPTLAIGGGTATNATGLTIDSASVAGCRVYATTAAAGNAYWNNFIITASADL